MSRVFHRSARSNLPIAVKGDGICIIDSSGKRYIDASGGAAVSCLGHSDTDVVRAIKDQVDNIAFAHTSFFSSEPAEELADLLVDAAPDNLEMVYFVSGGSEAVEAALLMARQYYVERGEPKRSHFIARRLSYHGNTLAALSVGANAYRRAAVEPMLMPASHIAPCFPYREQQDGESETDYGVRVANELETEILRVGAENVCAFVAETVGGATAGVLIPVPGYFKRIREICNTYGILLILDEVMCGMGRTGTTFAFEQEGITPDMVTMAKGLGGGYQPIGAVMISGEIFTAIRDGSGAFRHSHTYMGHPTACAAALAVQKAVRDRNLLENIRIQGDNFHKALTERLGNQPYLGDIRGRGLLWGVELVADRTTKQPFDPALKLHIAVKRQAMERGLICYPGDGTVDGTQGNHVLLAPPFIATSEDVLEIASRLGDAIEAAIAEVTE
jgi:adenosylmethionine-8-amino-7-oxononanoate aminotransferase